MQKQLIYITIMAAVVLFLVVTARCQELPDAPSKVADRNFLVLAGVNAAVTSLDLYTSISPGFHERAGCQFEGSTPWLYSLEPQKHQARAAAAMAGEAVASTALAYLLKKYRAHIWKFQLWTLPLAYEAEIHGRAAASNLRRCR